MGEIKVYLLLHGRVVGADNGGEGFDVEKKELVETGHYTMR